MNSGELVVCPVPVGVEFLGWPPNEPLTGDVLVGCAVLLRLP